MKLRLRYGIVLLSAFGALGVGACGSDGSNGANGNDGADGEHGANGAKGDPGDPGDPGTPGNPGNPGNPGDPGDPGAPGAPGGLGVDLSERPKPSLVGITLRDPRGTAATNLSEYVRALVELYATNQPLPVGQFPLAAASTDGVRALEGLGHEVVMSWLAPLSWDDAPDAPRFGANPDYIAYFGDGWAAGGNAPQFNGSDEAGWMWVNHEYVSNNAPTPTSAPDGQQLTLAAWTKKAGMIETDPLAEVWAQADVDMMIGMNKHMVGGSWMRVVKDPASGSWTVDRTAKNVRYDATSNTQVKITGYTPAAADHDDAGNALPAGVVSGIMGDCSGGVTPWGTVITAEENVQDYYGDLEGCWTSNQKLVSGAGCDAGAAVSFDHTPSSSALFGAHSDANTTHARDNYGFMVEMDPGAPADEYYGKTSAGVGHQKLGAMGRARWENATFAVDSDWQLIPNQPIVIYGGNDRRSGRIYKFVTTGNYTSGMTKAQIRDLLASGKIYVAHFAGLDNADGLVLVGGAKPTSASPGQGRWIELSTTSADVAPNAAKLGAGTTVGDALKSNTYNSLGGFPDDNTVRSALFTAATKVGVMELNRPEDLEWNPRDPSGSPLLYIAFTKNGRQVANDQDGVLYDPATHDTNSPKRPDPVGAVFALREANPAAPGSSTSFEYFDVWHGSEGEGMFDAANPDNIVIDHDGGVWFGTDGNWGTNGHADALYYLDLDPAHASTATPTYGLAFRVVATPSDAEATGPAFSSGMSTLFFNVQHPGEEVFSRWPN